MQNRAIDKRDEPATPPADEALSPGRALGAAVWAEMERHRITPTPHAYELWFSYRAGANAALAERMEALITKRKSLSATIVEALYDEFVAGVELDAEAIPTRAAEMQQAVQALAEHVAGGQAAVAGYSTALEHWAQRLSHQPSVDQMVKAVTVLTFETARAVERNRELERHLAASASRIAKLRRSLTDVKQEAMTDALTGIANRKAFNATLRRALAQARTDSSSTKSLLMLDIDHFKRFNDTHGHQTGDMVLRLVAQLLADNIKGRDSVARYGGEEFVILLSGADITAANIVGRQICEALSSKTLVTKGRQKALGQITVSVGAAQFRPNETAADLIARADAALYQAKHAGRNRVCVEAPAPALTE